MKRQIQRALAGAIACALSACWLAKQVPSGAVDLQASPASLDFGDVHVGTSKQASVVVRNVGGGEAGLGNFFLSGIDPQVFQILEVNCGSTVPFTRSFSDTCAAFVVTFAPTQEAAIGGAIGFEVNGSQASFTIPIIGQGIAPSDGGSSDSGGGDAGAPDGG